MSYIKHYKYTYCIQSNGSIIFSFDYFPYGFKINEIHYFNFFLEYENVFSKIFNFFYLNDIDFSYFNIYYKNIFLNTQNILKIISGKEKKIFTFYNNTLFEKKNLTFFDNVIIYNNIHIIKILIHFKKKIFFNIFFNL